VLVDFHAELDRELADAEWLDWLEKRVLVQPDINLKSRKFGGKQSRSLFEASWSYLL